MQQDQVSDPPKRGTHSIPSTMLAGALAGTAADAIMYPADALSTHMQTRSTPHSPRSLYRGFLAAALLGAPGYAFYLSAYDASSAALSPAAAGCVAELAGGLLFVPAEVLKRRAVLGRTGYARARDLPRTVVRLLRERGPRALYTGYAASVVAWLPFSALYFAVFERVRSALPRMAALPRDLVSGAAAGAVAAVATAPIDLIATRVQTGHAGARSVLDVLTHVVREEGIGVRVFFRAAPARVLWLAPQAAISISVFQYLKVRLGAPSANGDG